jgi:hexosaminidase
MKNEDLLCAWAMLACMCLGCSQTHAMKSKEPTSALVPVPVSMMVQKKLFRLKKDTPITFQGEGARAVAQYLADFLEPATGYHLAVKPSSSLVPAHGICLNLDVAQANENTEAYRLEVTPKAVRLSAGHAPGLFYGVQTLRQLLPPEIESPQKVKRGSWPLPCVTIQDAPRYAWRGMMLDVSRHVFPKAFIKEFIDLLAMHKLNTFHWHLVDDQGWRIEIKKYPKLTEIGAWRVDREHLHWNARDAQKPDEKPSYGGFYTQDDIREIVAYARSRLITIVPEIEMPAHVTAALAAYPELSCTGGPFTVPPGGLWPITDIYCAGNDRVFSFLEDVLTEVMDLFPDTYIHVGGDEATKTEWEKCPKCQARIQSEGLKDEHELQSYFIKRIEQFLSAHQRRLIGWDEILEGGLAPDATVMSWRGMQGGIQAAQQGHEVVMSPTSYCYFDYYQGPPELEPLAIGNFLPLQTVYAFDPTPPELAGAAARHILGGQANLWTEYVPTPKHVQYMTAPRIAALSEALWSPPEKRAWPDFTRRLTRQLERYQQADINYARSAFQVSIYAGSDLDTRELQVTLNSEIPLPDLYYTLDGSTPTPQSKRYQAPFTLKSSVVLKAGAFIGGELQGAIAEKPFVIHLATARPVQLGHAPSSKYTGGGEFALTNTLRGSTNLQDGLWQGYEGVNLEAVIDLGEVQTVQKLSTGFLQNVGSWVFLPKAVTYALSLDGKEFAEVATIKSDVSPRASEPQTKAFTAIISPTRTRFVKVVAQTPGVCPPWHAGAGAKCWIFVDEIVVE